MAHSNKSKKQKRRKPQRHSANQNKFKHQGLFGFSVFPLKFYFLRAVDEIITSFFFWKRVEYDLFVSGILRVTPTANTNKRLLNVKDTTLKKIITKLVLSNRSIQLKLKKILSLKVYELDPKIYINHNIKNTSKTKT